MNVITWATARSMKSGRPRAASQGMSREASHWPAEACSASSATSSAQIASCSLSVQRKAGAPSSTIAPSGAKPAAGVRADGHVGRGPQVSGVELSPVAQRRTRCAGWERRGENPGERAALDLDGIGAAGRRALADRLMPGTARPAVELERRRARRGEHLQPLADRHPVERGGEQDLQAPAELERFRLQASRAHAVSAIASASAR